VEIRWSDNLPVIWYLARLARYRNFDAGTMAFFYARRSILLVARVNSTTQSFPLSSLLLVLFLPKIITGMAFSEISTNLSEDFDRLRWPVFEDISEIRVADDSTSIEPELSPFSGYPIASVPATETPLHEIAFSSDDLNKFDSADLEAPEPLLVRRADGGVVTIGDVIEQLSHYFIAHKDVILEAKAPFLQTTHEITETGEHVVGIPAYDDTPAPPDTKVAFEGVFGGVHAGHHDVHVLLWADGEEGKSLEYFWKGRADPIRFPI
jgi:hypothetical protein